MPIYANAIPQVEDDSVGIHLSWVGPTPWVYSPGGWLIQRRRYKPRKDFVCDTVDSEGIKQLHVNLEMRLRFGTLLMREGSWPSSITTQIPSPASQPPNAQPTNNCEIFTLELDDKTSVVKVQLEARASFVIALRDGKAVAFGGPIFGSSSCCLNAIAIDTVILYTLSPVVLGFCIGATRSNEDEENEWKTETVVAKDLQLPIQQLIPSLQGPNAEVLEANARLLPGETLDEDEFKKFANTLRLCVTHAKPPRPIDEVLLMRNTIQEKFEELIALDPLRVLLPHPKWRRVLAFGWFDHGSDLTVGDTYEYRITGYFPADDIHDEVYGFHTIPSTTALPYEFYLKDLRLRLPQPVSVKLSPAPSESAVIQTSRRGISLSPTHEPYYLCPSLNGSWSLIIDFPSPVRSVILELHDGHNLTYMAGSPGGAFTPSQPVPSGESPHLDFPVSIEQLRLHGEGVLFSIRIPSGVVGLKPLSIVLPPVSLINTPRPEPPLVASIANLQFPQATPEDDVPQQVLTPQHALGFKIRWRPAPVSGLTIWPSDLRAAPLLNATIYQIEHRELNIVQTIPHHLLAQLVGLGSYPLASPINITTEFAKALGAVPLKQEGHKMLSTALTTRDANALLNLLLVPAGNWEPVLNEENWILGDRDDTERDTHVFSGVDLLRLFPEDVQRVSQTGLDVYWRDVFDFREGGNVVRRQVPLPGTYHQYRIATIDSIGRRSLAWSETNILRLEKHVPPPLPAGPDETTKSHSVDLPTPIGVQARVLVRDALDLTADDVATLGTNNNAIILLWGWHELQRNQDPFANEFRIYVANMPLDSVAGTLTNVTIVGAGVYNVTLRLMREVLADAAKGLNLQSGYPFYIRTHTAGSIITATLETRVPRSDGSLALPTIGPIQLPLHLTPRLTRPPEWSERVQVMAITDASQYETVINNRLTLTPDHPRDSIWVGVSSADDQPYVPDQLLPTENRPGNESAIIPLLCEGRYHGRPIFNVPPTLEPIPVFVTPEPTERPIFFELDLTPFLAGLGVTSTDLIRPERVSAAAVFAAYYTQEGRIMAKVLDRRDDSEVESEVAIPNPADRADVVSALNATRTDALEDRFVVFLAGSHPCRDRLFEPATQNPVPLGPFQETLPPKSGRYVYRIRKCDAAGHISQGSAMAKVVTKVPSMAPCAAPERERDNIVDSQPGSMKFFITPEPEITQLLTFSQPAVPSAGPSEEAALLRIPNAHDLSPNQAIWLRAPDGSLLAPRSKLLSDRDVVIDTNTGFRHISLRFNASAGTRLRIWACTLTRQGIPSLLGGPWSLAMPVAPLPVPDLSVVGTPTNLVFTWSWPTAERIYNVALERSADGRNWTRVSSPLTETAMAYPYTLADPAGIASGSWQYRLLVMSPDGRTAHSNIVTERRT